MITLPLILLNCIFLSHAANNIVLIIADDLDLVLNGMTPMTNTANLIAQHGATFTNCFVASPICCPNRASILTGQYQHNHLTVNNSIEGGCNSISWQNEKEPNTFAAHLKNQMGYKTFYAGKYLNQYGSASVGGAAHVPVGWDWWAGLVGNSKYYHYWLSINGTRKRYEDQPNDYLTDVITNMAIDFLQDHSNNQNDPFLMVLAPPAPHAPFTPAVRHMGKFNDTKAMRTPNFNTLPQWDKHWLVRRGPSPLPDSLLPKLDEVYSKRWETLLAVDEMVFNIFETIDSLNQLERTYVIFTSDNGYHIGQFSMPLDKRQPYETDIRVPLLIRGPGIEVSEISAPVSSVDLFATILSIAGIEHPSDGTSVLKKTLPNDRTLLIEYRGEKSKDTPSSGCPSDVDYNLTLCSREWACKCEDVANNTFACIRRVSPDFDNIFCVFEDDERFVEAYNISIDKYQLKNIGRSMKRDLRHRFRNRLKKMSVCTNEECLLTSLNGSGVRLYNFNITFIFLLPIVLYIY